MSILSKLSRSFKIAVSDAKSRDTEIDELITQKLMFLLNL